MKTKDLIEKLQKLDPTGEIHVCIDNHDIFSVSLDPAYWDGTLQVLLRDPSKEPYYNVKGLKFVVHGNKIVLRALGLEEIIREDMDAEIDVSDLPDYRKESKLLEIENLKQEIVREQEIRETKQKEKGK